MIRKIKNWENLPADIKGILDGERAFIGPEHIVIDLTNRCNLRCIGCWIYSPLLGDAAPSSEWMRQELSYETLCNLIDDLAEMGTSRIRFTGGGEPFLHPYIRNLLAYVKEKGIICAVTTNFTTVDESMVRFLVDIGLDDLAVSLWAHNAEEYALTHPGVSRGIFLHIENMLRLLSAIRTNRRPRLLLCNVLSNLNFQNASAMADFALDVGADAVYFTMIDIIEGRTDSLLLSEEQRIFLAEEIVRIQDRINQLPDDKKIGLENIEGVQKRLFAQQADSGMYDAAAVDEIPCYIGWMFSRITANGDVSPCCRGVNIPVGNINQRRFKDIWYGERQSEFRHKALHLKKSDPYFAKVGCYKTCDNLMHNSSMHEKIKKLANLPAKR